ncbi:hypothetical protein GCM10010378_24360 [Streptomyces viridochromogenes]
MMHSVRGASPLSDSAADSIAQAVMVRSPPVTTLVFARTAEARAGSASHKGVAQERFA